MSESILDRIQSDLVGAMKSRDSETTSTLRMLKAAIMQEKTRKPKDEDMGDDQQMAVLTRYVKQRRESMVEMKDDALKAKEQREIDVTQRYLPEQLDEAELDSIIAEAIEQTGATGPKEMGKVIGAVMARVKGRAEGGVVSKKIKAKLTG